MAIHCNCFKTTMFVGHLPIWVFIKVGSPSLANSSSRIPLLHFQNLSCRLLESSNFKRNLSNFEFAVSCSGGGVESNLQDSTSFHSRAEFFFPFESPSHSTWSCWNSVQTLETLPGGKFCFWRNLKPRHPTGGETDTHKGLKLAVGRVGAMTDGAAHAQPGSKDEKVWETSAYSQYMERWGGKDDWRLSKLSLRN